MKPLTTHSLHLSLPLPGYMEIFFIAIFFNSKINSGPYLGFSKGGFKKITLNLATPTLPSFFRKIAKGRRNRDSRLRGGAYICQCICMLLDARDELQATTKIKINSESITSGFHTGFSVWGGRCCVWVNWVGQVLFPGHAQKWC